MVSEPHCWDLGRTNSPTSARRGDGLGFIRIWATPLNRLVFWDGAPSPSREREREKERVRERFDGLLLI